MPARGDLNPIGVLETLLASAARTASGDTGILSGFSSLSKLRIQSEVTAISGVGAALDVVVEDTLDGTTWNTIGTFAQRTAVGREVINITNPFANRIRIRWTIAGTAPSVTFSVTMYGEQ